MSCLNLRIHLYTEINLLAFAWDFIADHHYIAGQMQFTHFKALRESFSRFMSLS